jgi:hypothetical protein
MPSLISAYALPMLGGLLLWHARLQTTSNVNSLAALPVMKLLLLLWYARLQARPSVSSFQTLLATVVMLL